jgi:5-phospho-D-xylono-1,4-lactonase
MCPRVSQLAGEVTFIRTVRGDVRPADLGVTYAHEHVVIDGGRPVELNPDFLLADLDRMTAELLEARSAGLAAVVDAMPCDAGRNATKLAELSRRTGIHVVAPTGIHHERYYSPNHWSAHLPEEELADRFVADIELGIDANDYGSTVVNRTSHRAGVIKIAGSEGGPSARDARIFQAAASAHVRTGAPILTHCENGTGALEQVELLRSSGVAPDAIALSHVDKVVDRGYQRAVLDAGAFVEYDQAFRWADRPNGTLQLIEWAVEDGRADRILLGMDAARQGYYRAWGGSPGLAYLLTDFTAMMDDRGIGEDVRRRLFIENPARAFAFSM